jgi:hypothetical protein
MSVVKNALGARTDLFGSHAFVRELREKGRVNDELAPFCVVSCGRFGRNCFLLSSASLL